MSLSLVLKGQLACFQSRWQHAQTYVMCLKVPLLGWSYHDLTVLSCPLKFQTWDLKKEEPGTDIMGNILAPKVNREIHMVRARI